MLTRLLLLFLVATGVLFAEPEYPKFGADIYDRAVDSTPAIEAALKRAGADHKHVLLMFGANWCVWCHRLHAAFAQEPVASVLKRNYELVLIDVNKRNGPARNAAVNERYGNPIKHGLPVLVVLDTAGKVLTTQETGALEDGKSAHDPAKVRAFLEQWAPGK